MPISDVREPTTNRPTAGLVESVERDGEEIVLSIRLDADSAGTDLHRGEVVLNRPLFLPEHVEDSLLDALDPRGGPRE